MPNFIWVTEGDTQIINIPNIRTCESNYGFVCHLLSPLTIFFPKKCDYIGIFVVLIVNDFHCPNIMLLIQFFYFFLHLTASYSNKNISYGSKWNLISKYPYIHTHVRAIMILVSIRFHSCLLYIKDIYILIKQLINF